MHDSDISIAAERLWRACSCQAVCVCIEDMRAGFAVCLHIMPSSSAARPTVLAVQPRAWHGTQEELGAVCVGPRVGHAQQAWHIVLQREVLIGELGTIDRLATRAITVGEVSTLRPCGVGTQ